MRRNRNMGRGGVSGRLNQNISGGPLVTEHLKDIDLELELLKRKREMIEQQQYLQPFNPLPQRNYNQQPFLYQSQQKQGGSNRDFSHLYNDGPQQFRKPFGKKRQSDNDWHDSFPKRPTGQSPRRSNFAAAPPAVRNPRPFSYALAKQFIGQKIVNQKQPKPDKKIAVANKITKPTKAFTPPNKIVAQPVAERNNLVAAAMKSVAQVESQDREALRLLPNKMPTKQMTGRLELALGCILRDIREKSADSPHEAILRSASMQRVIKQTIRERIRNAMLGKVVGATQEIITEYRNMFPKETDIDILNTALDSAGVQPETATVPKAIVPGRERPDEFYKDNMYKLIDGLLQDMFTKLEEIYNPPSESESAATEGNTEETNNEEKEVVKTAVQTFMGVTAEEELTDLMLSAADCKRIIPRLLKKHIPTIIKVMNVNKMYKTAMADITATARAKYMEQTNSSRADDSAKSETTLGATQTPMKFVPSYMLPYYVKVMGKPQLPKKKVMHTFLEVFHPKSIKKHRSIHNLLFIGFSEKSDFDGIVKADGTVIGRSTLSIRICDKNAGKMENNANVSTSTDITDLTADDNDTDNQVAKKDCSSEGDIIGKELDGQITDLLTSIRSSEEEKLETSIKSDTLEQNESNGTEKSADAAITIENGESAGGAPAKTVEADNEKQVNEDNTGNTENNEKPQAQENGDKAANTVPLKDEGNKAQAEEKQNVAADNTDQAANSECNGEKNDQVTELKNAAPSGRSTPTRASTRLGSTPSTPSSIRTRRASRLIQN